ncbi:hypothetical protein ANO14919_030600 [Xylariales sp. No.14919]|nr:hypothetical protein ANO14919_030600 [Xylariales sp. No.14919]
MAHARIDRIEALALGQYTHYSGFCSARVPLRELVEVGQNRAKQGEARQGKARQGTVAQ